MQTMNQYAKKDAELFDAVRRLQAGDADSTNQVYELSEKYIYKLIYDIVKDYQIAEKLMQDSYIQIYNGLDMLQEAETFYIWAGRIATNMTLRYIRQYRKESMMITNEKGDAAFPYTFAEEDTEEFLPENVLDKKETQRLIAEIVDSLSIEQKLCVQYFYYEDMSVQDIAATMGCTVDVVRGRLNYARKAVKEAVAGLNTKSGEKLYSLATVPVFLLAFRAGVEQLIIGAGVAAAGIAGAGTAQAMGGSIGAAGTGTAQAMGGSVGAAGTGTAQAMGGGIGAASAGTGATAAGAGTTGAVGSMGTAAGVGTETVGTVSAGAEEVITVSTEITGATSSAGAGTTQAMSGSIGAAGTGTAGTIGGAGTGTAGAGAAGTGGIAIGVKTIIIAAVAVTGVAVAGTAAVRHFSGNVRTAESVEGVVEESWDDSETGKIPQEESEINIPAGEEYEDWELTESGSVRIAESGEGAEEIGKNLDEFLESIWQGDLPEQKVNALDALAERPTVHINLIQAIGHENAENEWVFDIGNDNEILNSAEFQNALSYRMSHNGYANGGTTIDCEFTYKGTDYLFTNMFNYASVGTSQSLLDGAPVFTAKDIDGWILTKQEAEELEITLVP